VSVHPQSALAFEGSEPSIRVLLADDHARMRHSLRLLLDGDDMIDVVSEAGNLLTVMRDVPAHRPRVLVIDLSMSNGSSLEAIRQLRTRVPGTEIVVVTMDESSVFAAQALDAGAVGFVIKHAADAELAESVRRASRGEEYVSPRVAARLASRRRQLGSYDGASRR
jgi:two-component system, NarL family, response regulator NreC